MYPWTHFIYGLIFALIGIKVGLIDFNLAVFLVLFTLFVDLDHLINYFINKKSWNLFKAWNYYHEKKDINPERIFHSFFFVEIVLLLSIILYFINAGWSYVLFAGYIIHRVLDYLNEYLNLKIKYKKIKIKGLKIRVYAYEIVLDIIGLIVLVMLI